jgi:glycosyltransferase involved in cell wall biosynthesis
MNILFDHQAFSYQDYGGVSRYFLELYNALGADNEITVSVKFSNNELLEQLNQKGIPFFPKRNFIGKRYLMNMLNIPLSKRRIRQSNFDVFHPTYFDPYFIKVLKKPGIITVHDLTVDLFPQYFKSYDFAKRTNKEKCFKSVNAIIAVSENTKRDIVQLYDIPEEKIQVIYHGVNNNPKEINLSNLKFKINLVPKSYILYVGSRKGYKNFLFFVNSIGNLILKEKVKMVCIGGGEFNRQEIVEFRKMNIESNILYFDFSEITLNWLYQNALFFVFPSLYEGFGMPILEAFSNRCAVVLSDRSCFSEIAGDAAVYFEPDEKDSIIDTTRKMILDSSLRKKIIEKGGNRVKYFTWEKAAKETLKAYINVIS